MKKRIISILIAFSLIFAFPVISYASGVNLGDYTTKSVGDIKTIKDGAEVMHIYASDFDYLANELKGLITRKDEIKTRVNTLEGKINSL